MIVLECNNISISFGIRSILENISFKIQETDKVGLIGVNGAGKSTLMKIILGALQPDGGAIFKSKGLNIGYLEQNSGLDSQKTIWDEMISTYSDLIEAENYIKSLEKEISTENNTARLDSLMKEYGILTDKFARSGGYEYNSRTKGVLRGLGFNDDQFCLKTYALSGGQKTRLALAGLLLSEPDILLLDEPTNHLDMNALEWLEDFLKNYKKSIVVVSHDRYFLDAVTNKTLELESCRCKMYNGSYTAFVSQKSAERESQLKHYEQQQKEIAHMEAFIEQQRRWNREKNIVAAESRQKAIDRLEKIDKPNELPGKVRIRFRSSIISGNDVVFVENLSKEYPQKPLFRNIGFNLKKSEKVFLIGPNGCGKSTLLKILVGKLENTSGKVEYGHNVVVGYYDQEQEELNNDNSILEEVWDGNDNLTQTQIRNTLASFLFTGDDVFKPISILSGGEKSRVSLAKLMLSGANLLILDEPTNHLDINSREALESSLTDYEGTLMVVSHDRYFINKLATRILEFNGTNLEDYKGSYPDYLERKKRIKAPSQDSSHENRMSASKLEHLENKEEKSRKRKIEKQIGETEDEINKIELRLSDIVLEMAEACSDHIKLVDLHKEQGSLETRLEELYEIWEKLTSESS